MIASGSREGVASQLAKKDKMALSAFDGFSSTCTASDSAPASVGSHLIPSADDYIARVDKGKGPAVDTFVNNPKYAFKKMIGVVPRGDLKTLLTMNSGALY